MSRNLVLSLLALCALLTSCASPSSAPNVLPAVQAERLRADTEEVIRLRHGMKLVTDFLASQPGLFPAKQVNSSRLLRREEKEIVWNTWQRLLDLMIALDSLERTHRDSSVVSKGATTADFPLSYAAFLAEYRGALDFIACVENNPELDTTLNEPVPELGLPANTYARLKFRFLNVAIATEFAARDLLAQTNGEAGSTALQAAIHEDSAAIWRAGRGTGVKLTAKNAWHIFKHTANAVWLPVQAGVSEWMGDTKVYRSDRNLIAPEQVGTIGSRLEPGDILLERREWYLSNIGLPGYWPHAALYIGTPEERQRYFNTPEIHLWLATEKLAPKDFDALLLTLEPRAYAGAIEPDHAGHAPRLLEAMSEGVCFTTLEHSAGCDALAVLRPRNSKVEKARAILRAFHYSGRPYDFDFDFATDATLVCTELVYKSYEPATGFTGIRLEPIEMLGRKVLPANEITRQFDAECGQPNPQFDFVLFLDGSEESALAVERTLDEFRQSWHRPKWHIITPRSH